MTESQTLTRSDGTREEIAKENDDWGRNKHIEASPSTPDVALKQTSKCTKFVAAK